MRLIVGVMAMLAVSAGVAHADRIDQVRAYTRPAAAAFFAEAHCPGTHINKTILVLLRVRLGISDTEEPFVDQDLPNQAAEVRKAFERAGATSWCSDVRSLFGRTGSLIPGLLE